MNKQLDIYQKLLKMKIELANGGLSKTGRNTHSKYKYFELEDIVPAILKLSEKYNVNLITSFPGDRAICNVIDLDNPGDVLEFEIPVPELVPGSRNHNGLIQARGAYVTYLRRYLYMIVFDIVESDIIDSSNNEVSNEGKKKNPKRSGAINGDTVPGKDKVPKFFESTMKYLKNGGKTPTKASVNIAVDNMVKDDAFSLKDAIDIKNYITKHPEVLQ